jgi:HPt (histidine-containing phosphotransfer) domain-containing protein
VYGFVQAGGDLEFLTEVLQDLLDEAETAKNDIQSGLTKKDFDEIMKAAHRLKGSAAYLGCEAMRDSMMTVQLEAKKGITMTDDAEKDVLHAFLQAEYEKFLVALTTLKEEVAAWFEKNKA